VLIFTPLTRIFVDADMGQASRDC